MRVSAYLHPPKRRIPRPHTLRVSHPSHPKLKRRILTQRRKLKLFKADFVDPDTF